MQRIAQVSAADASAATAELFTAIKNKVGAVPNILATMGQSPAVLEGYLGFSDALAKGRLSAARREQIALAVAGANSCDYCASVHSAVGSKAGLGAEEIQRNLEGFSSDPETQAILEFTNVLISRRGNVSAAELDALREAGFNDEEIVEIVANAALNIFTNYFNHVVDTDIDFPVVRTGRVAA